MTSSSADGALRLQQQNDIIKYGASRCTAPSLLAMGDGGASTAAADKSKKSLIFKSNVIAKKAKFWRFLEDDDKSKKNSLEDLSSTSSGKSR